MELKLKAAVIEFKDDKKTMRVRINVSDEKVTICSNYSFGTKLPKTVVYEGLRGCLGEIDTAENLQKFINTAIEDSGVYLSFEEI